MIETQRQMTIKKKYILSLIISVSFTVVSLLLYYYMLVRGNAELSSYTIWGIVVFARFVWPVLFVAIWGICVRYYVMNEKKVLGTESDTQLVFGICSCTAIMLAFGVTLLYLIGLLIGFQIEHRSYIDELSKWLCGMKISIIVCIIVLALVLMIRRMNMTKKKSIDLLVVSCLLFLVMITETKYLVKNADEEAFWIRINKGVEFEKENGPYVENPYSFSNYHGDED